MHRQQNAFWLCSLSLLLLSVAMGQLILEDVVEDGSAVGGKAGLVKEATDPLTKTLQWAVDNSDHESMAERAKAIREGKAEPMKLDREVMDAIFGSKVSFLEKSVDLLNAALAAGDEEQTLEALENLEDQVTDIDNANDLDNIGGVEPVLGLLTHHSPKIRAAALWVVGTAAQSNPSAQEMFMNYRVLPKLMSPMTEATKGDSLTQSDPKLLAKSLYAVSTLLRGCGQCLEMFLAQDGANQLSKLLAMVSRDTSHEGLLPVKRKLVALVGDLAVEEVAPAATTALVRQFTSASSADRDSVSMSVARLLGVDDRELQEKSLQTLVNLLGAEPSASSGMLGARLPELVQVVVERAADKLQREDEGAWEEAVMLGRQLLDAFRNQSRDDEM